MTDHQQNLTPEQQQWIAHIEHLFRHAGTGTAATLVKQAVRLYRWPNTPPARPES